MSRYGGRTKAGSLRRLLRAIAVIKSRVELYAEKDPIGASGLIDKLARMETTVNRCLIAEKSGMVAKSVLDIDAYATAAEIAHMIKKELTGGE